MIDVSWFADLQEALVIVYAPILMVIMGVIFIGSVLGGLVNLFLDVAGHLFKT